MKNQEIQVFNLRLPKELKEKLQQTATKENRSLNQQMVYMLEKQDAEINKKKTARVGLT